MFAHRKLPTPNTLEYLNWQNLNFRDNAALARSCSHKIALLEFTKPAIDTVLYTLQQQFLLAFGTWRVLILGPGCS